MVALEAIPWLTCGRASPDTAEKVGACEPKEIQAVVAGEPEYVFNTVPAAEAGECIFAAVENAAIVRRLRDPEDQGLCHRGVALPARANIAGWAVPHLQCGEMEDDLTTGLALHVG